MPLTFEKLCAKVTDSLLKTGTGTHALNVLVGDHPNLLYPTVQAVLDALDMDVDESGHVITRYPTPAPPRQQNARWLGSKRRR